MIGSQGELALIQLSDGLPVTHGTDAPVNKKD